MDTLKLRKEMFPAIYSGDKTCTSRQGIRNFTLYDKLIFVATEDNSISTDVIITNVKHCKFDEITEEEAFKEGYKSLEELKEVLRQIYDISKDDNFTLIEFAFPYETVPPWLAPYSECYGCVNHSYENCCNCYK